MVTADSAAAVRCSPNTQLARYSDFNKTSSVVAKWPRDASCLSVVSFNSTKRRVESSIVSHVGYRFITACN